FSEFTVVWMEEQSIEGCADQIFSLVTGLVSRSTWNREVGRNFDCHGCAAAGIADDFEDSLSSVKNFEELLDVLHSDAGAISADSSVGAVAHANAIIGHFDDHTIAVELTAQGYGAAVNTRLETMLDGIFDERLKKDAGDQDIQGVRVDFLFDMKLV